MATPITITRDELDAVGSVERHAAPAMLPPHGRMLAPALVREGASRMEAAQAVGMDRQTRRDWVHRCNEEAVTV